MKKGNLLFGQSGGPTAVINASAQGVFQSAFANENIDQVYGAINGINGILTNNICCLNNEDPQQIELLKTTPSSALGSVRYKLKSYLEDETDYIKIIDIFDRYNIKYFLYNGGNDSMDTCNKIAQYCKHINYDISVIGVPKTVDNDLFGTDHCPGFASAAKYLLTSIMELSLDTKVYDKGKVTILEVMGRNAGWLTAATKVASFYGNGPDLIYLPEAVFDLQDFLAEVKKIYALKKHALIAVSEGIRDKSGKLIAEYIKEGSRDAFNHLQLGGVGAYLSGVVVEELGIGSRAVEFSLLQRCASHIASQFDVNEAYNLGAYAVECATNGISEVMISCSRNEDNSFSYGTTPLVKVANAEQTLPLKYINEQSNNVCDNFMEYILPLIQGESCPPFINGIPQFAKLNKVRVNK